MSSPVIDNPIKKRLRSHNNPGLVIAGLAVPLMGILDDTAGICVHSDQNIVSFKLIFQQNISTKRTF